LQVASGYRQIHLLFNNETPGEFVPGQITIIGIPFIHSIMYRFMRFCTVIMVIAAAGIFSASAASTLTEDDSRFLTDVMNEGIPMLYVIPATMNAGIFHGDDAAIASIGQEQTAALDAFLTKINGYTLSDEVKVVRDQFIAAGDLYKKDLAEYSTLNKSCGSCITKMNEMYPELMEEARNTSNQFIVFLQKSQAPLS